MVGDEPVGFDDFALAERATPLAGVIAAEIAASGPITFARFMALALGHPEHGYYSRAELGWGAAGDFETSPEVHPIFGYLWARQVAECWERLGRPAPFDVVEVGAGSGAFAVALLGWLRERAPDCYAATRATLVDVHARRVEAQRARLAAHELHAEHALLDAWLARTDVVQGVVLSNELFDALPVHVVERRGAELCEWYVAAAAGGGLVFELGAASTPAIAAQLAAAEAEPGEGCRAEVSLAAPALLRGLARRLGRGYLVTIDYGYEAQALYAPWRRMGTLMAFRGHSPQPDPLARPGETDLTAHVDLTTLARAGEAAGCAGAPTVSQAEALAWLGSGEALAVARARAADDAGAFFAARRAVETLSDSAGLGRIRVLVQAKDAPLNGLRCLGGGLPPAQVGGGAR
ncbi:MAG: SAM-dependent methyltransferase [Dehalococcoidia bacterium]|nr:SAM-dependent methyltransferase [Dehalococcoidia bacterium]MSQ36569.1 SAM-dependent methyltransferase [Dehalococcoidia bacterium]